MTNMQNKLRDDSECLMVQPIFRSWNLNTIKSEVKQLARYHIQHHQLISKTKGMLLTASCSTVWNFLSQLKYRRHSSNVTCAFMRTTSLFFLEVNKIRGKVITTAAEHFQYGNQVRYPYIVSPMAFIKVTGPVSFFQDMNCNLNYALSQCSISQKREGASEGV